MKLGQRFVVGLLCGVSALVLALVGINSVKPLPLLMGSIHALTLTIVCMVIMRDMLRDALLKPAFDVHAQPKAPQWVAIALFLTLFVVGIAASVWLLRLARKAAKEKASRGEEVNRGPGLTDSGLHIFSAEDSQAMRGGSSGDLFPRNPS